jgi:hypothetical protein
MTRPIRGTSSNDLAAHETGFSPNGESMYSRQAARSTLVNLPSHAPKTRGKHTTAALIAENRTQMAKLVSDLLTETDPTRRAAKQKNLDIKSRFIERLKSEKGNENVAPE